MSQPRKIDSTRFFYIQEGLVVGVWASIMKVIFPTKFPFLEFCIAFVLPLLGYAFGVKTWGDTKDTQFRMQNGNGSQTTKSTTKKETESISVSNKGRSCKEED
jgi:hypothetical protein